MRGGDDTIFAAATAPGRGAVTVLRMSGGRTRAFVAALAGTVPRERRASLRVLRGADGEPLDHAIVLWFPAPRSYTGEDCAEFHLHGGRAVLDAVAGQLIALTARPAEPGEFTRRSFLNGKRGLIEAEAVSDLVEAETEAQRRQAVRQLQGGLSALYDDWIARARGFLAREEAAIDFADEDSVISPHARTDEGGALRCLRDDIERSLADAERGQKLRDGLVFVIAGRPNVGKSSLMNHLAGEEAAIVAATPGTTRDPLERRIVFGGVPVTLVDTAGLRETDDPIEQEGVRRSRSRILDADLVLYLQDARSPQPDACVGPGAMLVASKVDLLNATVRPAWAAFDVSVRTGAGLEQLRLALDRCAGDLTRVVGGGPLARSRHRAALTEAAARLDAAASASVAELRAEELRLAVAAMGRITGQDRAEDVLDAIFARFCIGK